MLSLSQATATTYRQIGCARDTSSLLPSSPNSTKNFSISGQSPSRCIEIDLFIYIHIHIYPLYIYFRSGKVGQKRETHFLNKRYCCRCCCCCDSIKAIKLTLLFVRSPSLDKVELFITLQNVTLLNCEMSFGLHNTHTQTHAICVCERGRRAKKVAWKASRKGCVCVCIPQWDSFACQFKFRNARQFRTRVGGGGLLLLHCLLRRPHGTREMRRPGIPIAHNSPNYTFVAPFLYTHTKPRIVLLTPIFY